MNKSREIILERLKNNTNETSHTKVDITKKTYDWSKEEIISKLSENLQSAKAETYLLSDAELIDWLNEELPKRDINNILMGSSIAKQISKDINNEIEVLKYDDPYESWSEKLFNETDASITTTIGAIAQSGSIVLHPTPEEPRLMSLVPDIHIALVYEDTIYETFEQIITNQYWVKNMPTNALLISGPSKTADIEQVLAYGVHGPKELIVLILTS
jgi:L-lactate dehydrogenase complex protein LldG|tara:strand:- start:224 stop:868 length:645 start_codon:yes stop_codon:yes gene_type:complete